MKSTLWWRLLPVALLGLGCQAQNPGESVGLEASEMVGIEAIDADGNVDETPEADMSRQMFSAGSSPDGSHDDPAPGGAFIHSSAAGTLGDGSESRATPSGGGGSIEPEDVDGVDDPPRGNGGPFAGGSAVSDSVESQPSCRPWGENCDGLATWATGQGTRFPLVLVHGFFGWDQGRWLDYFYGIPERLNEAGFSVFVPVLDPINHSDVRSLQLARFIDKVFACTCVEKLNLIGHSQGGLDARYLIGPLEYGDKIASVTTISSPHLGFELAEDVAEGNQRGMQFLEAIAGLMSWFIRGHPDEPNDLRQSLTSMSVTTRSEYNRNWSDSPGVATYSFAGLTNPLADGDPFCGLGERAAPRRGDLVEPALLLTHQYLGGFRVPNDGLVPVAACIWGRFLGCLPADHFDQIGQIGGLSDFDFRGFYVEHARFLRSEGH